MPTKSVTIDSVTFPVNRDGRDQFLEHMAVCFGSYIHGGIMSATVEELDKIYCDWMEGLTQLAGNNRRWRLRATWFEAMRKEGFDLSWIITQGSVFAQYDNCPL